LKPFTRAETGAPPAGGHAGVSNNGSDTAGARNWHALAVDDVFIALNTSRKGLSETDAAERAARYGLNQLPPPQIRSGWQRLLAQFHNVLITCF